MTRDVTGRVLVAGIGNIFNRDDGFGPEVARRLLGRALPNGVRVVDYGIRGMHLAYDLLDGYDVLVLVDAIPGRARDGEGPVSPGTVRALQVRAGDVSGGQLDAHGMDPATVLANLAALGGSMPATTLVVGCAPESVDEGVGLSDPVAAAVDVAADTVLELLTRSAPQAVGS